MIIIFLVGIVVAISGCINSDSNTFNNDKISFNYPESWNVTGDSTDIGISLEGKGILTGSIYTEPVPSGNNQEVAIREYLYDAHGGKMKFDSKIEKNGYDYYFGFDVNEWEFKGVKYKVVYYEGVFVKNGMMYRIFFSTNDEFSDSQFDTIVDSFKIK